MIYLYSRKGKFLGTYDNIFLCSKKTGYNARKLEDSVKCPGAVFGSVFAVSYKWGNSKENRERIADEAFNTLNKKSKMKILKMLNEK